LSLGARNVVLEYHNLALALTLVEVQNGSCYWRTSVC